MLEAYPGGIVPDNERDATLKRLDRQSMQIAQAYDQITSLLGTHLRRELDRRYLLSETQRANAGGVGP
jgi:hypothetical protein